jgi:hypothetical protein
MQTIGKRIWSIAEGYIPPDDEDKERAFLSHETACILNAGDADAQVEVMIYFHDREPVGPYRFTVPARRTYHMRFNDLTDPAPVPKGTDYSSVIRASEPVIVQHTRLDSRIGLALLSTMAYPVE